jgi:hypothetical protein
MRSGGASTDVGKTGWWSGRSGRTHNIAPRGSFSGRAWLFAERSAIETLTAPVAKAFDGHEERSLNDPVPDARFRTDRALVPSPSQRLIG